METIHVRQRLRPSRYAFVIDEHDVNAAVQAASLNSALWGGIYNPIVPRLPAKQRDELLRAFDPDFLVDLSGSDLTDDLLARYEHRIIAQTELVVANERTQHRVLGFGFNVYPIIRHAHQEEIRLTAGPGRAVLLAPQEASGWPEFTAFIHGSYRWLPELDINFETLFRQGLRARTVDIPELTPVPDYENVVTLVDFTRYGLRSLQRTASFSSHIVFIGDHTNLTDLLEFWNIRATGRTAAFIPVAAYQNFEPLVRIVAAEGQYPINQQLNNDADIQKGPSISENVFNEVSEWIATLNLGALPRRSWRPRFGQPPIAHYVGDIHVSEIVGSENDDVSILQDGDMTPVKAVRPPALSEESEASGSHLSWSTELTMIGTSREPRYMFSFPNEPVVEDIVRRSLMKTGSDARLGRRGLVLNSGSLSGSSIYLKPVNTTEVIRALFRQAKLKAEPSQPGQYAEQIIRKMGSIHFDCRIFKLRGLRDVLDRLGDGSTVSKADIYQAIMSTTPDAHGTHWRPDLYDGSIHGYRGSGRGRNFDFGTVFDTMLEKRILRPGLVFRCHFCLKDDWYHVSEFAEDYKCRFCFTPQRVDFGNKHQWQYKADGMFQVRDSGMGSVAVILSLWRFEHIAHARHGRYLSSHNLVAEDTKRECEIDYAYVLTDSLNASYELILGQATRFGDFTDDDMQKMSNVADRFEQKPYLAFSTLRDQYSEADKERLRALSGRGYQVIAFTREELDAYDLYDRFKSAPHKFPMGLRELSENTISLNLGNHLAAANASVEKENTMIEQKTFRSTGIDLRKLRQQREWRLILQMLRVFNDITLGPAVSFLVDFAPNHGELEPIHQGVSWHLMRWRCSMATEAMNGVIAPLQTHQADANHEIWHVIRTDSGLSQAWDKLTQYFSAGKYLEEKTKSQVVRNRLFAHYDKAPISCAFEKLLALHQEANEDQPIGWHLQSLGDNGQISRNIFIDELMNLAWYEIYEIDVNARGPDQHKLQEVGQSLTEFLSLVANFVNDLVIAYCEQYQLTTIVKKPPWLK